MADTTKTPNRWTRELSELLVIVCVIMGLRIVLAELRYIPSGSMEPTLLIGDEIFCDKFAYGYSVASLPFITVHEGAQRIFGKLPKRGDVVTFRWPGDGSEVWVKRVIGLPGDRIQMVGGILHINGQAVGLKAEGPGTVESDEGAALPGLRFAETLPGGVTHQIFQFSMTGELSDTDEVVVPADHLFVMGDDRDYSADSRVPVAEGGVGLLPVGNLIARVDGILGSWDFAAQGGIGAKLAGIRWRRFFSGIKNN